MIMNFMNFKNFESFRNFKIPIYFLLFGTVWVLTSDPMITLMSRKHILWIGESFRSINDFLFVVMATGLLYLVIRDEAVKRARSEAQYKKLFFTNPNPMWIYHNESLRFIEVNNAAIEKYGYQRKEFLAMSIMDIRPASDKERLLEAVKAGDARIADDAQWEHILKSGKRITVTLNAHRLEFNGLPCSMVMITDVTDVVQSNRMLQAAVRNGRVLNETLGEKLEQLNAAHRESRRMAEVIDKISNLVLIVSREGQITWVNRAFTEFTGYGMDEVTGKNPGEVLFGPGTDTDCIRLIDEAIALKTFFTAEIVNYKKGGEAYWTQLIISPIFDSNGRFEFFISVENIITERKEREARLVEHYRAFREIAWSNSHEVRRPLASLLSLLEVLKQGAGDEEKQASLSEEKQECLRMTERCALELDALIRENARRINELEQAGNPFGT